MEIVNVSSIYFSKSKCCYRWAKISLYCASLIIIISIILPAEYTGNDKWYYASLTQIILVCAFQVLSLIGSVYNFIGRKVKINDLVDNSFDSNHSSIHSKSYYDNEEVQFGYAKYYLNTAESCFFSYKEMLYMQFSVYSKNILLLVIFISGLALKNTEIILSIFQLSVLFSIVISTVRFIVTLIALHNLFSRIDASLKHKSSKNQFVADSINYSLEYETAMVWYNGLLSETIYEKHNIELTNEWNALKQNYKLI